MRIWGEIKGSNPLIIFFLLTNMCILYIIHCIVQELTIYSLSLNLVHPFSLTFSPREQCKYIFCSPKGEKVMNCKFSRDKFTHLKDECSIFMNKVLTKIHNFLACKYSRYYQQHNWIYVLINN